MFTVHERKNISRASIDQFLWHGPDGLAIRRYDARELSGAESGLDSD